MQRGVRFTFLGWSLSFGVRGNEWFGCSEFMNVHSTSPSPPKEMNGS